MHSTEAHRTARFSRDVPSLCVTHTALKVQQQQHLKILNILSCNFFEKSNENLGFSNKDINEATYFRSPYIILEVYRLPHFSFILPILELLFFSPLKS